VSPVGRNVTGVVAALRAEARSVGGERAGLMVRVSGMGCERAARSALALVRAGAGSLLCWGVAGALDPALGCGDIVLASEVICETPLTLQLDGLQPVAVAARARLRTSDRWRGELYAALARQGAVRQGAVLTRGEVACEASLKAGLFEQSAALAVDLESAAVGVVAGLYGLPFMVVRVIADTAADTLPPLLGTLAAAEPRTMLGRLAWLRLLCRPAAWPGLLRLARRYRAALRVLRRCARAAWSRPAVPAGARAEP